MALTFTATPQGDGTVDFAWSGFNLTALDADGTWQIQESSDGGATWVDKGTPYADNVASATGVAITNTALDYIYKIRAYLSTQPAVETSNVVTIIRQNAPVTGLSIVSATDDGSGTSFSLEYTCTEPATYTATYVRVEVTVEDVTVYSEDFAFDDTNIAVIDDLPGVPGNDVAIFVTVLGRTGVLGAASAGVADSDTVADDSSYDADVEDYLARIDTAGTAADSTESDAINDWVLDGKANGWLTRWYELYLFWWGDSARNAVSFNGLHSASFTSITHSAGYISGAAGHADLNHTAGNAGFGTGTSSWAFQLCGTTTNANVYDFGVNNGPALRYYTASSFGDGKTYSDVANSTNAINGTSAGSGLVTVNWYDATNIESRRYNGTSNSLGTKASAASAGSTPTGNLIVGGLRASGTPGSFSGRRYSFAATGNGMTTTQRSYFEIATRAMLLTKTGAT